MAKPAILFIGGYTKSGTTFLGRVLEAFEGVYSRGEMDYLRIFSGPLSKMFAEYNQNIQVVNEEVYDGQGKLGPVSEERQRVIQRAIFMDIFFNGSPVPEDCRVVVEKSPRNLFNYPGAQFVSLPVNYINIYRPVVPVFKSLVRHMADNRSDDYHDPESEPRQVTLERFVKRWNRHIDIINHLGDRVMQVQYDTIVGDLAGFLDFVEKDVFSGNLTRVKGPEDLTKEAYLKSLPPERRAKSLVQTATRHIVLSDHEMDRLTNECEKPRVTFRF